MLVLSRAIDEKIIIVIPPSNKPTIVEVIQVDIRGSKSRLGIQAPRNVTINRSEVQDQINIENLAKLGQKKN